MPALLFLLYGCHILADLPARPNPRIKSGGRLWAPFRLQFYCNGHSWLARKLTAKGIGYTMADNAFIRIDDWSRAQALANTLSPDQLHRTLDRYAERCCPVSDVFGQSYHGSLMQVEYATDLVFRSATTLKPLYEQLVRESVLSVKAEQLATFLGRQITPLLAQEIGSQFSTRIEGTWIKHHFGKCSIKMYDKLGIVLRIETTTNDVSFFKHHRKVEHRKGPATRALAPVKKSIYSLIDLREILLACNRRYLVHLSALDDFSAGVRALRLRRGKLSTVSPSRVRWTARPSRESTSSNRATALCCMPCKIPGSTLLASAGRIFSRTSTCSRRPACLDSSPDYWTSA
jgi:hypothetical protein